MSSRISPSFIFAYSSSRVSFFLFAISVNLSFCCLAKATCLALFSSSTTVNMSPADGTSWNPITSTGVEGIASIILLPVSSINALTLPAWVPARNASPILKVPDCTSTVAIGPLPLSSFASTIVPRAFLSGLALSSITSACRSIISSRVSIPMRFLADTSTKIFCPPHSSGIMPCSASSFLTFEGFASGLSILFNATTIGTFAAFAWLMASTVCGMTPSSAATTRTTISVTFAPLALIEVNAS